MVCKKGKYVTLPMFYHSITIKTFFIDVILPELVVWTSMGTFPNHVFRC